MTCESCGDKPKKCDKDFTKAVIGIDNPEQITLMRKVTIPASMGDDTTVPPVVGKYKNVLLYYESNQKSYLYSSDGIPTQLTNGITDYEAAVNLPQINSHTLIGDKTGDQLGLQNKLTAGDNISIENNIISATDTTYGPATDTEIGLVKPGDGLEVANDGTLSISDIEQYAHFFDTVADMKAATNLVAGDYAKTLGFYTVNDGGGALYKITDTGTANEMDVIAVGSLYANLVIENTMNVEQFGAKGDGTADDSDSINAALSSGASVINFAKGKTYNVRGYNDGDPQGSSMEALAGQHGLMVQSNTIVELNESTIKCIPNNRTNYNIFSLNGTSNIIIRNGKIIGDVGYHTGSTGEWGYGIALKKSENIVLENLYITLCWGDGVNLQKYTANGELCKNIVMNNVTCYDNRRQGMSIESVDGMEVRNCKFNNTGDTAFTLPGAGVDIEPTTGNSAHNIKFFNCEFNNNYGDGFEAMGDSANIEIHNSKFVNNKALSTAGFVFFNQCPNSGIYNSKFEYSIMDESATWHYSGIPIYLNGRFEIIGCDFINLSLQIRRSTANDRNFVIKDCNFYINTPMSYNRAIEITNAPNTTTVNGCELYVQNCNFENTSNDKSLSISAWISGGGSANNFSKVIIENNYFYGANRAIDVTYLNSCIKNNHMVLPRSFAIQCSEAGKTHIIDGNIIEECSWDYNNAGIIHNDAGINLIFTNNKFFKRATNLELAIASPTYTPSRWLQNSPITGIDEEHENYIIDNSSV